jgi:hypothetical protein
MEQLKKKQNFIINKYFAMTKQISFKEYIKNFQDWFEVGKQNERLVELLTWYALQPEWFEAAPDENLKMRGQDRLYKEKGILLIGPIGAGKTTFLTLYKKYLMYLKDPRAYKISSIPELADSFVISGRDSLSHLEKGNWFLDELCYINERSGKPEAETIMHFGDKVLLGEKLIYSRHQLFIRLGWQTHFTTNANLVQIEDAYSERAFSRVMQMCNVFKYIDDNKRSDRRPKIHHDSNSPAIVEIGQQLPAEEHKEITVKEKDEALLLSFSKFQNEGNSHFIYDREYDWLVEFGYSMPDLAEYRIGIHFETPHVSDHLKALYAKKFAVADFYRSIITTNAKLISFIKL